MADGPWTKYQQSGPWQKYARGRTDPAATAELNAKTAADIQAARDEAMLGEHPIASRAAAFNEGLPFVGQWLDEGMNALDPGAGDFHQAMAAAVERQRPGQNAALELGGGVAGTVAALPLAPEFALGKAGSILGKTGATAAEAGILAAGEGTVSGAGMEDDRGGNALRQALMQGLLGAGTGAVMGNFAARSQRRAAADAVPDLPEIKAQSQALYKTGETTGKTASRAYTNTLQSELMDIAKKEAAVTPSGAFNEGFTGLKHAMKMVSEYAGQKMDPKQMRSVRDAISAAAEVGGKEGRVASMMLRKFDDFVAPLVPEYKQADKLWGQYARGKEVNQAIDLSRFRKGSTEMALSGQFSDLARGEIRGDLTYPKELVEAVERVALGGGGQKAAATVARLSPQRLIGGSTLGGVGGAGLVMGEPLTAAAVGGTLSGAGLMGQMLANRLAKTNAREAAAVARSGAPLQMIEELPESIRAAIAALIAREATAATGPQ